ncbi:carbohydrate ABC transporter permease [Mycoplasmopsis verecunda]|uniref:Multiple sugar transport system permease protein n=1 Tax=Mycoplasmopsis verecunda TaxID=171291 RepID=A0A1T4LMF5_9BACT|nr:sugar ABC transporter permease [Mycoplasmopsis verecunda]WPB54759.1 sugar ABC transporter permease [Mycoplasmopsis verecunda]SJZ55905.1 multiple sugar transport system permease protein [Mycoplasmopsis verecunda]
MRLLNNNTHQTLQRKVPFLFNWSVKKQSSRKSTLSHSILDSRTPAWKPLLLLLPGIILLSLFTIAPMFINIIESFSTSSSSSTNSFTWQNYLTVLTDARFAVGVRNSFIYGMFVLPFVMMISLVISSVIAKLYRKYAKSFWQTVFFMPYVTNGVAVSLAFIQLFGTYGLLNQILGTQVPWLQTNDQYTFNALIAMIINGIWNGLAFNILIFTTAMLGVDKNLYRSASIDGTGEVKQFFTITLPSIKSTINFLITLGIIGGLKVFPLALFENKPANAFNYGGGSLMLYVYLQTQTGNINIAGAASISLFIIGVTFSSVVRGGFFMVQTSLNNLGERNVWVKVKATKALNAKEAS